MKRWNGPCGDPYCYLGAWGSGFAGGAGRYKDGPCNSPVCMWFANVKSQDSELEKKTPGDPI